jgi:hypothetical protein
VNSWLRSWRTWLLLPWLLAAGGCGPGVGGTGTGDRSDVLTSLGAKAASVCTATFAGQLKCPSRVVIGPTQFEPTEGSEPVVWVDDAARSRVVARIDGSDVEFDVYCDGIRFVGTWGIRSSDRTGRFYGHYTTSVTQYAVPGTLSVQVVNGVLLSFVLEDASGLLVFGPKELQRGNGQSPLPSCG